MALTQYTYAEYDADWFATFLARCEKSGLGLNAVTLTNYDTTGLPAIAAGSVVEINGAVGRAATEQAISGSATGGVLNYIYIDASTWVATWTVSAPAWDTAKQGYYSGNNRYVGGCWYDGANYTKKFVYFTRSVREYNIENLNVTTGKIADLNVTTGKIADGGVGLLKLATNVSFVTAIQRYYSFGGGSFHIVRMGGANSVNPDHYSDYETRICGSDQTGAVELMAVAPLLVPNGAYINEIRFYGRGPYGSSRITKLSLQYAARSATMWTLIGSCEIDTNSISEVSSGISHTVDFANYMYHLEVRIEDPNPGGTGYDGFVGGVRVAYTVAVPLP